MNTITFEEIVSKTKRMLGKNYKGDKEPVPVYTEPVDLEGQLDAYSVITNSGFTDVEVALINEKVNNYAWWVANKGYLLTDSERLIPALFIYGSEVGSTPPDVLNCLGSIENNLYLPINRTDMAGVINNSQCHLYIQFIEDSEKVEFDINITDLNNVIEINDKLYYIYFGRVYPEDRVIVDNKVCYLIHLISNLNYYYIPVVGGEAINLGGSHNAEPIIKDNLEILEDTCEMVIQEAAQWTNRNVNLKLLNDCWPVIVKCSCMAYLNRGAEGLNSQSELGQQNVYNDWVTLMHKQITNRRYVM